MPATDRDLLALVDTALGAGARRAGAHLACRTGCTPCCHGPFPIHALDAWRLRQGLEALRARDPAAAEGIAARARREVAVLSGAFPGDPGTGILGADDAAEEAWCERHRDRPCPALEPGTGSCLLYEARPLSCRTFGLPVRLDGEDLPACTLCFRGAASSEVEACRVTVAAGEIEAEIARHHGLEAGETAIAWVLARA